MVEMARVKWERTVLRLVETYYKATAAKFEWSCYICQVNTNCELLMYIYLMNGLFICYMLWARDVSKILEYKPSLKLLTINRRTGRE